MGSTIGAAVAVFVEGRLRGARAVVATTLISLVLLGLLCNLLCFNLDHQFHFFGGHENSPLFILNGMVMSAGGGLVLGYLLYTDRGNRLLERTGL